VAPKQTIEPEEPSQGKKEKQPPGELRQQEKLTPEEEDKEERERGSGKEK
jgi:hypothetical protein